MMPCVYSPGCFQDGSQPGNPAPAEEKYARTAASLSLLTERVQGSIRHTVHWYELGMVLATHGSPRHIQRRFGMSDWTEKSVKAP